MSQIEARADRSVVRLTGIRETPLSVDEILDAVGDPAAGGICLFVGVVRREDEGREVTELGYSAHPTAERTLREIAERIGREHPVTAIAVVHRTGDLAIGERAIVAAVSSPHRAEAFEACRDLVDAVKSGVPLWKHQRYADGDATWVGSS